MTNKYQTLNVLNRPKLDPFNTDRDAIAEVASMINASGNRSQRKRLERTLNKTQRILDKCEKASKEKANKELDVMVDSNFMYIFACVGLTLNEDYHWKEDPNQEHGQITSLFERVTKRMEDYLDKGMNTDDIIELLNEKTGVQLVNKNK